MRKQLGSLSFLVAALGLTLAALALRLYRVEYQSLWWDEGVSLYLVGLDLPALTIAKDFAVDLHPPLYHVALMIWTSVAGSAAFAVRYLSVAFGVLTVAATIALGRMVAGRLAGLIAGVFVTASPFLVFYAQEARMYSLVPFVGLVSTLLVVRILRAGRLEWRALALLAVVNAAALYTYYYLGLLIFAQNVSVLVGLVWPMGEIGARRRRRLTPPSLLPRWLLAQALTALAFLPWLAIFASHPAGDGSLGIATENAVRLSAAGFARDTLVAFAAGFSAPPAWAAAAIAALVTLAAVAVLATRSAPARAHGLLLSTCVLLPLALAYAIHLWRPFYYPRFVVFAAPLLAILAASGAARLLTGTASTDSLRLRPPLRIAASVLAVLLLGIAAYPNYPSLRAHYSIPRTAYSTSDYRVILRTLASEVRPGDLVLGSIAWQIGYVKGYLPNGDFTAALVGSDPADAVALARDHERVWLLGYSPDRKWLTDRFDGALGAARPVALIDQHGDSRLTLYSSQPVVAAPSPLARLGSAISLESAELPQQLDRPVRPGAVLDLTLRWRGLGTPDADYTVFTHAIGPDNRVHAQFDAQPVGGAAPTGQWRTGVAVVDRYRLPLAADAPTGDYVVEIGMYDAKTGARLPVGRSPEEADRVIVGRFTVVR